MDKNTSQLKLALAVATVTELRSYLRGELDRFELIADVVERHKDRAETLGDLLEEVPQVEFRKLCQEMLPLVSTAAP